MNITVTLAHKALTISPNHTAHLRVETKKHDTGYLVQAIQNETRATGGSGTMQRHRYGQRSSGCNREVSLQERGHWPAMVLASADGGAVQARWRLRRVQQPPSHLRRHQTPARPQTRGRRQKIDRSSTSAGASTEPGGPSRRRPPPHRYPAPKTHRGLNGRVITDPNSPFWNGNNEIFTFERYDGSKCRSRR